MGDYLGEGVYRDDDDLFCDDSSCYDELDDTWDEWDDAWWDDYRADMEYDDRRLEELREERARGN